MAVPGRNHERLMESYVTVTPFEKLQGELYCPPVFVVSRFVTVCKEFIGVIDKVAMCGIDEPSQLDPD
jgi:hypothetical protein